MVRGRLDEVARLVPRLVDRLSEGLRSVGARRPFRKCEAPTDDSLALEEEDEIVEPGDEQGFESLRLARDLVTLMLLDRLDVADEVEEREACGREQLGAVRRADDEADVRLVLEGLPAQE